MADTDRSRISSVSTKSSKMETMNQYTAITQLPLSVQANKKPIVIAWSILILGSFVIPNILWFVLEYGTNAKEVVG